MKKYCLIRDHIHYIIIKNPSDSQDFILGSMIFVKDYIDISNKWIKCPDNEKHIISPFLKDCYKILKEYNTLKKILIDFPELMLL